MLDVKLVLVTPQKTCRWVAQPASVLFRFFLAADFTKLSDARYFLILHFKTCGVRMDGSFASVHCLANFNLTRGFSADKRFKQR